MPFFFHEGSPLFYRYNTPCEPARLFFQLGFFPGIFSWDFFQPKLEFSVPDESISPEKSSVTIYTDGAAEPNPGPGGYGIVLMAGKHRKELSGGFRLTTNNRMELMGVIVALEALSKPCLVNLYSDSKYVVDTVQRGSVLRWQKNRWLRSPGQPVKNVDLWKRYLVASARHSIRFHWVKGHAGVAENERCDVLAVQAATSTNLGIDEGYEKMQGLGLL